MVRFSAPADGFILARPDQRPNVDFEFSLRMPPGAFVQGPVFDTGESLSALPVAWSFTQRKQPLPPPRNAFLLLVTANEGDSALRESDAMCLAARGSNALLILSEVDCKEH